MWRNRAVAGTHAMGENGKVCGCERQQTDCLVCGEIYQPRHVRGLVECRTCGFISAKSAPTNGELAAIYDRNYFHRGAYYDYLAEEEDLRRNFRNRLKTLRKLVPDFEMRDFFEIGCAYGFFLAELRGVAKFASGIDISADAVHYAREVLSVDAQAGDYLSLKLERKFDVIALWDTIEHLKRPDLFIAKIWQDLQPSGFLALTTGDIGSLNARLRGRHWRMIHPPTHLHYFSVDTIMRLLNRYGFDIIHVSHPGISRTLGAILFRILGQSTKNWFGALSALGLFHLHTRINLFDVMYIIARRR